MENPERCPHFKLRAIIVVMVSVIIAIWRARKLSEAKRGWEKGEALPDGFSELFDQVKEEF